MGMLINPYIFSQVITRDLTSFILVDPGEADTAGLSVAIGDNAAPANKSNPTVVAGGFSWRMITTAKHVSAATPCALGIKSDYTLWVWGIQTSGQLGNGVASSSIISSPIQVGTSSWKWVSTNGNSSAGITIDGKLFVWGLGTSGILGLGNTTSYSSPKALGTSSWKMVCVGTGRTFAVDALGRMFAWGSNTAGALGLGNTTNYSSPKQVGSGQSWRWVDSPGGHAMAIRQDYTLWAWGTNSSGQLGFGNTASGYSLPFQSGSASWKLVVAGGGVTFGIKTDYTLWSWGTGSGGALGLGNTSSYSVAKQIGTDSWYQVSTSAGSTSTYGGAAAIKNDFTLWTWGANGSGELALGNITAYSIPKKVGTSSWANVSKGRTLGMIKKV